MRALCRGFNEAARACAVFKSWYFSTLKSVQRLAREKGKPVDQALAHGYAAAVALAHYLDLQVYAFGVLGADGKPTPAYMERQKIGRRLLSVAKACGVAKSSVVRASDEPRFDPALAAVMEDRDDDD